FLAGRKLLFWWPRKGEATDGVSFVEAKTIEECKLGVHGMAKHDVTKLVCQEGREASLVRKHIQQTATHDDGMTHGIGFKTRGHEHTAADLRFDVEAIGDKKVVHYNLESLVHLTIWSHQLKLL